MEIRHEEGIFLSSGPPFLLATALIATLAFLALVGCGRNSQSENPKGDNKPQAASPTEVTASLKDLLGSVGLNVQTFASAQEFLASQGQMRQVA
jgi:hypothetical protein